MRDNARILVKELKERCPDNVSMKSWILHLFSNLLNNCYLVVVSTSNFDTAYRIFSTINSRGLDLQLNDILKSEIIGNIEGKKDKEKYTQIWEGEESDLGRKDFEALFSHIHRIKTKERVKENLLKDYRKKIKPQDNPTQFIDEDLKPCSDVFEIIRDQRFICDNKEDEQEINRLFGWLNLIDNSDWLPPAIDFLVKYPDKASQIKDFFTNLERLAAGLMIIRADINQRIKRYKKVLEAIENSAEDAIAITEQLLSPQEQNQIIKLLDGNLYEQSRSRLYVLKRLDSALAEGGLSLSFDAKLVTIEHVLPQNPKADSEWCNIWEDEVRKKWVHRLGNLVLLSRRKNSSAQNYDFEEKKEKYFDKSNPTIFPITVNVIREKETDKTEAIKWDQQIVEAKQKDYLTKLVTLWDLEKSTEIEVDKKAIRKEFWSQLIERMNLQSNLYKNTKPKTKRYLGRASGIISGVSFQFAISNSYCYVEVYIERKEKKENKFIFEQLFTYKDQIEKSNFIFYFVNVVVVGFSKCFLLKIMANIHLVIESYPSFYLY